MGRVLWGEVHTRDSFQAGKLGGVCVEGLGVHLAQFLHDLVVLDRERSFLSNDIYLPLLLYRDAAQVYFIFGRSSLQKTFWLGVDPLHVCFRRHEKPGCSSLLICFFVVVAHGFSLESMDVDIAW